MGENWDKETMVADAIKSALDELKSAKPNDRSEEDRRYAIVITEMEKVLSYYEYWIGRSSAE